MRSDWTEWDRTRKIIQLVGTLLGATMKRLVLACVVFLAPALAAQQPSTDAPYKVLKAERVGGEGGWDYLFADPVGRRLYIPRGGTPGAPATDSTPARPAGPG